MTITLNGQARPLPEPTALTTLLKDLSLEGKPVLVEYNKKALVASAFKETNLKDGDRLEVLVLGAGG